MRNLGIWMALGMIFLLGYLAIAVMQDHTQPVKPHTSAPVSHPIRLILTKPPGGGCRGPSGPPCVLAPKAGPPSPDWPSYGRLLLLR